MASLRLDKITLLAEKKLSGVITPEEQKLLDEWLNQEPGEQVMWNSEDVDETALRERLLSRIKEDANIPGDADAMGRIGVLRRYRWMAAAVLLLFMTTAYFLSQRRQRAPAAIAQQDNPVQQILPGHSGAILTLANGQRIVLDSAANGTIAIQGAGRLVKHNGELSYEKRDQAGRRPYAHGRVAFNTLTIPRGRKFRIILADGTQVWLNAASSITYPTAFTGGNRSVTVTGEAYFEVAKDAGHPFIVSVGSARITVLGTDFNVMAYPDEKLVKATLLEGSIKVSRADKQVIIAPGQQASFAAASGDIQVKEVQADQAIAWVHGKLSLNNLGVEEIMRQISRWYDVDVEFTGPPSTARFWGLINRDVNLSEMLKVMRANGIDAHLQGRKVIVSQ